MPAFSAFSVTSLSWGSNNKSGGKSLRTVGAGAAAELLVKQPPLRIRNTLWSIMSIGLIFIVILHVSWQTGNAVMYVVDTGLLCIRSAQAMHINPDLG
jgi:hypothetical protein